jgi:hypothetical protein
MCIALGFVQLKGNMKEEFDKAISTAIATKDVQFFGKLSEELRIKYNVSKKTVHNRFHSMFGCSFRDYIDARILPSKEELTSIILNTSSSEECRLQTKLSHRKFVGLYDKLFGVSTYKEAKKRILLDTPTPVRLSSLREDNLAILMSQYLGDGSYDRLRHSLRIQHGEKQAEYLRWKVGLIIEGYNLQTAEITERTHAQGHKYFDWYSRKLGNVDFPEDKSEVPKLLTPLGWLLWYFDDGTYGQDISICTNLESVAKAAQIELKTYGIDARVNKVSTANAYLVTMCGGINSIRFYKAFIEPFLNIIPNCMKYKTEVKI